MITTIIIAACMFSLGFLLGSVIVAAGAHRIHQRDVKILNFGSHIHTEAEPPVTLGMIVELVEELTRRQQGETNPFEHFGEEKQA